MFKFLAIAGGLVGAASLSQFPEFSQQYTQRLAGQVDALSQVVADFEASALDAGLTRSQALDQMSGTPFLDSRRADMTATFSRHAALSDHLAQLRDASPISRLTMPQLLMDGPTLSQTWGDFQPAMPLTTAGALSGGVGYLGGWGIVAGLLAGIGAIFRRKSPPAVTAG